MPAQEFAASGPRVCLRPLRDKDVPVIEPWYADAAASAHGLSVADSHSASDLTQEIEAARAQGCGGVLVITRAGEDEPIGLLDYRVAPQEEQWATVRCVALAPRARRWGLAMDAVPLFEEEAARRWRVKGFRANVDVRHGLALYFWLRLGYRPLAATLDSQGHEVLQMAREAHPP